MVTDDTTSESHLPPYVSYSTFERFLDWLSEMPTMPSQIDRSLWSTKFSGSNGAQLISGLRFLGLLDAETPQDALLDLVEAKGDRRRDLLRDVLRNTYGPDLIDGLATRTPKMVDDVLREIGTTDSTHRKAVSFFINAAKAAAVPMPPAVAKRARKRPLGAGRKPRIPRPPGRPGEPPDEKTTAIEIDELRAQYIQMLMAKADESGDATIFDRIESLLGFGETTDNEDQD